MNISSSDFYGKRSQGAAEHDTWPTLQAPLSPR